MLRILYLGDDHPASTSAHRASALERLGHTVYLLNPANAVSGFLATAWLGPVHYRIGYRLVQGQVLQWIRDKIRTTSAPDLVWVNSGELLGPACMEALKELACPIILYNNDDPTGGRDGRRFDLLLQAIPYYDLCVVRRDVNLTEYKARGAKEVLLVRMSYDELAHRPFAAISEIPEAFRSEVAFIGTWMRHEKRDEFLLELLRIGVPLSIWGARWQKSPRWKYLKQVYRGGALGGRDYVAAMQGAKLCLGLLSKGNRDLHTRRSVEIPFAGGLLCAERTVEHQAMYQEGVEAVFWNSAAECAKVCLELLGNAEKRESIRLRGMQRVQQLAVGNERVCSRILAKIHQLHRLQNPQDSHVFAENL